MAAKLTRKPTVVVSILDHNKTPEQAKADREERERVARDAAAAQLVSITHRIRQAKLKSAAAKAEYDAVRAEEVELYRLAKVSGFTRDDIDEDLRDLGMNTREYLQKEDKRAWRKEVQGLAKPQAELLDETLAAEKRDEVYWRMEGYRIALNFGKPEPQSHEAPPAFFTAWMEGWHDGAKALQQKLAEADAAMLEEEPEGPAPVSEEASIAKADDFEMSEEERAAQRRPGAVQDEAL